MEKGVNHTISEEDDKKIYEIISSALYSLCENKPNDPIDYLSRKMFELIGDDPEKAMRKKIDKTATRRKTKQEQSIIFSKSEIAIGNLDELFENHYEKYKKLLENCYVVRDLKDGSTNKVANFIIKKDNPHILYGERIIKNLIEMDHPSILRIQDIFQTKELFIIVEDYVPANDLGSWLFIHKGEVTMELIKVMLTQILQGLNYLHSKGIVHRNINFDKIFVFKPSLNPDEFRIKIGGFFYADYISKGQLIHNGLNFPIKEPYFAAPEYMNKKFNNKVDIWSLGVLAYSLLIGPFPFSEGDPGEIFTAIYNNEIPFPKDTQVDESLIKLVKSMLTKDFNKRPEASELLKHKFFADDASSSGGGVRVNMEAMNILSGFKIGEMLRRSILSYIMSKKLYDETDTEAIKAYELLDVNHDGQVDADELFEKCGDLFKAKNKRQKNKKIKKFIEIVDINGDGTLEYSEFLTIMTLMKKGTNIKVLAKVFDFFDKFHTGFIEPSGLREIFESSNVSDEEIHQMLDEFDQNGDRKISFREFLELVLFDTAGINEAVEEYEKEKTKEKENNP